ncbi:hypothetical protein PUN28_000525 [Cardiocondyla obscurior]|uniref:K Homology domain-containing protein n=1 Tax=Cardiocondyla obscurior TaxID=286306 RepID=A0AAW2GZZ4_9HYME
MMSHQCLSLYYAFNTIIISPKHMIRSDPLIKRWLKFLKKVSCLMAAFRKGHIKVLKWMDGQLVFETSLRHPADREDFEATGNETYVPGKGKKSYNNQYDGDTLNTSSKTSNTSPKQSGKREEGWKEVVRMGQSDDSGRFMNLPFRSKKVSVPTNAISRVIGRGGSHINAIRGATAR